MPSLEERYLGSLIGLACGDALGGPVEFLTRPQMDDRYPTGLRDFIGGGWLDLSPGEITDDTQMALDVARSLVAHPDSDMDDLSARFVVWRNSEPKDIGNTTRDALDRLANGTPWQAAGEATFHARGPKAAAGNGAIMRCAPIALRFRNDPARLRSTSTDVSRITHATPICTESSVAVNQLIALLVNEEGLLLAIDQVSDACGNEDVRSAIDRAVSASREQIKSGGYVLDTLGAALWSVVRSSNFEESVVTAVGLGGDTDTTAAVAGAMAGALFGFSDIPVRWASQVQHRDELESLALQLLQLTQE